MATTLEAQLKEFTRKFPETTLEKRRASLGPPGTPSKSRPAGKSKRELSAIFAASKRDLNAIKTIMGNKSDAKNARIKQLSEKISILKSSSASFKLMQEIEKRLGDKPGNVFTAYRTKYSPDENEAIKRFAELLYIQSREAILKILIDTKTIKEAKQISRAELCILVSQLRDNVFNASVEKMPTAIKKNIKAPLQTQFDTLLDDKYETELNNLLKSADFTHKKIFKKMHEKFPDFVKDFNSKRKDKDFIKKYFEIAKQSIKEVLLEPGTIQAYPFEATDDELSVIAHNIASDLVDNGFERVNSALLSQVYKVKVDKGDDLSGNTLLHHACVLGDVAVVQFLVESLHCPLEITNNAGDKPEDLVTKMAKGETKDKLQEIFNKRRQIDLQRTGMSKKSANIFSRMRALQASADKIAVVRGLSLYVPVDPERPKIELKSDGGWEKHVEEINKFIALRTTGSTTGQDKKNVMAHYFRLHDLMLENPALFYEPSISIAFQGLADQKLITKRTEIVQQSLAPHQQIAMPSDLRPLAPSERIIAITGSFSPDTPQILDESLSPEYDPDLDVDKEEKRQKDRTDEDRKSESEQDSRTLAPSQASALHSAQIPERTVKTPGGTVLQQAPWKIQVEESKVERDLTFFMDQKEIAQDIKAKTKPVTVASSLDVAPNNKVGKTFRATIDQKDFLEWQQELRSRKAKSGKDREISQKQVVGASATELAEMAGYEANRKGDRWDLCHMVAHSIGPYHLEIFDTKSGSRLSPPPEPKDLVDPQNIDNMVVGTTEGNAHMLVVEIVAKELLETRKALVLETTPIFGSELAEKFHLATALKYTLYDPNNPSRKISFTFDMTSRRSVTASEIALIAHVIKETFEGRLDENFPTVVDDDFQESISRLYNVALQSEVGAQFTPPQKIPRIATVPKKSDVTAVTAKPTPSKLAPNTPKASSAKRSSGFKPSPTQLHRTSDRTSLQSATTPKHAKPQTEPKAESKHESKEKVRSADIRPADIGSSPKVGGAKQSPTSTATTLPFLPGFGAMRQKQSSMRATLDATANVSASAVSSESAPDPQKLEKLRQKMRALGNQKTIVSGQIIDLRQSDRLLSLELSHCKINIQRLNMQLEVPHTPENKSALDKIRILLSEEDKKKDSLQKELRLVKFRRIRANEVLKKIELQIKNVAAEIAEEGRPAPNRFSLF